MNWLIPALVFLFSGDKEQQYAPGKSSSSPQRKLPNEEQRANWEGIRYCLAGLAFAIAYLAVYRSLPKEFIGQGTPGAHDVVTDIPGLLFVLFTALLSLLCTQGGARVGVVRLIEVTGSDHQPNEGGSGLPAEEQERRQSIVAIRVYALTALACVVVGVALYSFPKITAGVAFKLVPPTPLPMFFVSLGCVFVAEAAGELAPILIRKGRGPKREMTR